ncbi:MAG: hypothetical protein II379_03785, partial [Oscillospiraceae bacterium]|nr:hypothetical protein [Oscillospiraceae bacterium]
AAADPALEAVPSTNLQKKSLNKSTEKHFLQVCASASTRIARAAAEQEAGQSSTAKVFFQWQKAS